MVMLVLGWLLLWRKAWNFCHQWSGITWLFQRCMIIPSLFGFFLPDLFFCCQVYFRDPGAIFRHHVNHNFSSYYQYFNFIFSPLLLPPMSDMAAQQPWRRQGTVGEMCAYLSAEVMDLSNSAIGDHTTCEACGHGDLGSDFSHKFSVLWCLPLLSLMTGFSTEQWPMAFGWGNETPVPCRIQRVTN